jgi:hypothetical protein
MQVKGQCFAETNMLIIELDWHFVDSKLMNALDIVYPQFWMQPNVDFFLFAYGYHKETLLSSKKGETFSATGCRTFGC